MRDCLLEPQSEDRTSVGNREYDYAINGEPDELDDLMSWRRGAPPPLSLGQARRYQAVLAVIKRTSEVVAITLRPVWGRPLLPFRGFRERCRALHCVPPASPGKLATGAAPYRKAARPGNLGGRDAPLMMSST